MNRSDLVLVAMIMSSITIIFCTLFLSMDIVHEVKVNELPCIIYNKVIYCTVK